MKLLNLFFLVGLVACQEPSVYTIKKGKHESENRILKNVPGKELNFSVKFDSTALYTTKNPANQHDINKLYGFREGYTEKNSARLGWNTFNGKICLYPYVHKDGVNLGAQDPKAIDSVVIGERVYCSIRIDGDKYIFRVRDNYDTLPRGNARGDLILNFPYFGGDETAPHDIHIRIYQ